MTAQCPNGHTSSTDDFCDVCGAPIDGATPSAPTPTPTAAPPSSSSSLSLDPPPSAAPAAPPLMCPNCGEGNLPDALFCEKCGYDFTTGQKPAEPIAATVPAPTAPEWVAEVWVDPDWFAAQDAAGKCPTSGAPNVVTLAGTEALIGRGSKSRGIVAQIDCSADGSVSHRHAQLTLDHDRWSIEDLGSTNGTFIGTPGDPLPTTPIVPHERQELADGARVYVGAWCRIMVRKATDDEKTSG